MVNFNTNQTRQLYVAKAVKSAVNGLTTAGDILLGKTSDNENIFFHYVNSDGDIVRSDSIKVKNINYVKKTAAAALATPLKQVLVSVDTSAVTLANCIGKEFSLIINLRGLMGYDETNSLPIVATVVGNATNTANASAFHKALADAIALALPRPIKNYPYIRVFCAGNEVDPTHPATGTATAGITITETAQKYVRGKLSNEPVGFDVAFAFGNSDENLQWGTATQLKSGDTGFIAAQASIPGYYKLADLEHFAMGERGDYFRGWLYPMDYEFVPMIELGTNYDVLSIEYFYQGMAEDIQKSPRLIQIAGSAANITSLETAINAIINPPAETSGQS